MPSIRGPRPSLCLSAFLTHQGAKIEANVWRRQVASSWSSLIVLIGFVLRPRQRGHGRIWRLGPGVGTRACGLGLCPLACRAVAALSTLSTPPSRRLVGEPLKLFRTDPSSNQFSLPSDMGGQHLLPLDQGRERAGWESDPSSPRPPHRASRHQCPRLDPTRDWPSRPCGAHLAQGHGASPTHPLTCNPHQGR